MAVPVPIVDPTLGNGLAPAALVTFPADAGASTPRSTFGLVAANDLFWLEADACVGALAVHSVNNASTSAALAALFSMLRSPLSSIARVPSMITCCVTRASPPPMEMRAAPSAPN